MCVGDSIAAASGASCEAPQTGFDAGGDFPIDGGSDPRRLSWTESIDRPASHSMG